jgi:NAD-reducing hydrogenase large subunit
VHGTGAIPGGINKNLSIEERDFLLADLEQMMEWSRKAVKIAKDYTVENLEVVAPFGSFDSNHLSIVRDDGAMDLYHGNLRAIDAEGKTLIDQVDPLDYLKVIAEEVRPWSYMKFPFLTDIGPENGWYRVGPLARINTCDFIDTPEAEDERQEFMAVTEGKPNNITMAYHWARMIELLHSGEKIQQLLIDSDLQGDDLIAHSGERRGEYVAIIEAPRGTLTHHYKVDENDQVTMANLIVSTTCNNEPMNRAVRKIADDHLSGVPVITEPLLNNIEVGIRAYDPCLSCATHALGQMPLEVTLVDHEGSTMDRRTRD